MNSEKQKSITLGFICLAACLALLFLLHPNLLKQFPVLFEKEGNALLTGMAISALTSVLVSFLSHYFFQILYMERLRKERDQKAEAELQHEEENFQHLLEHLGDGFFTLDEKLCYTYVNKRICEWSHKEPAEMLGRKIWDVFPNTIGTETYHAVNYAFQHQKYQCSTEFIDKHELWEEYHIYPSSDGLSVFVRDISELKKTEIRLHQKEKQFRSLIENSDDLITLSDKNGRILYISPALEKITGYSLEELKDKSVFQLNHPEHHEEAQRIFSEVLHNPGIPFHTQKRLFHRNGSYIWVEGTVVNLLLDNSVRAVVSNYRDITQRKQTEKSLAESESFYESLFENFNQGFAYCRIIKEDDTTTDFEFVRINNTLFSLMNLPEAEGKKASEIFPDHKNYLAFIYEALNEVEKSSKAVKVTYKSPKAERWFEVNIYSPLPGYFCILMEETSLSRKFVEQESLLVSIINTSKDAIFSRDVNGLITSWNLSAEKLFGYTSEEAIGMSVKKFIPEELKYELELAESKIKVGESIEYVETKRLSKSGSIVLVSMSVSPLTNEKGDWIGASIIARDITAAKMAESLIKRSEADLRSIFENSSEAIVLVDNNFKIKTFNKNASSNLLLSFGETAIKEGDDYFATILPERRPALLEILKKVLQGEHIEYDIDYFSRSENPQWFHISFKPVYENNDITGFCVAIRDITTTKLAESKLTKSESNLRTIFENSSESFALLDRNFIIKAHNSKAAENVILQKGKVSLKEGVSILDCIVAERVENTRQLLQQVLQGKQIDYETDYYSTKEKPHWIRGTFTPVFTLGEVSGLCVAIMDITKDKLAEANLKESEENLRAIFDNATQGFVLLEPDGRVKSFNSKIYDLGLAALGSKLTIGSSLYDYVEPNRLDFIKQALYRVSQGEFVHYQHHFAVGGRKKIWVEFDFGPVYTNNKVTGICVSGNDITQKMLLELEKEFDQKNLESLINNTTDMIFSIDKDYRLITFNNAFSEFNSHFTGRPSIKGENMSIGGSADFLIIQYRQYIDRALQGETFVLTIKNTSHRYGWSEVSFFPIFNNEEVIGTACFVRNITERIENEQLLIKNSKEKEDLIQMLSLNNKDLQQFAYITSHNLRGPVANLLGLTNLLDNYEVKDKTLLQILNGIKTAAIRFDETIRDLSTILTIKDNPSVQIEELHFSKAIAKVKAQSSTLLEEIGAKILTDFRGVDVVYFNRAYFESIITNLISNAIKYRDSVRPLMIKITTELSENNIVFRFSDNGIGMDVNLHKEKLFKLYQRFHSIGEGKGLGLFLIKSQLETLGGTIQVESTVNKGTEFILKFKKIPKS